MQPTVLPCLGSPLSMVRTVAQGSQLCFETGRQQNRGLLKVVVEFEEIVLSVHHIR